MDDQPADKPPQELEEPEEPEAGAKAPEEEAQAHKSIEELEAREPGDPEATPHTTGELDAAATKEAGGPKGGLGLLFIAAGLALAMVLGLVAVMGYFALKP